MQNKTSSTCFTELVKTKRRNISNNHTFLIRKPSYLVVIPALLPNLRFLTPENVFCCYDIKSVLEMSKEIRVNGSRNQTSVTA